MDPLYLFVFLGLFTPGPNVILLTASGARFGFRATLPHVSGVVVGVGILAGLAGLGSGALFHRFPALTVVLGVAAAAWILWMALGLWRSGPRSTDPDAAARPWTIPEAMVFQWINPKLWAVIFAAATGFPSDLPPASEALRLASAFAGLNLFVCLFWSFAGSLLARLMTTPTAWRVFTRIMAVALAGSAVMVFL